DRERLRGPSLLRCKLRNRPLTYRKNGYSSLSVELKQISIGPQSGDCLASLPVYESIVENQRCAHICIVDVMMYQLVVPFDPARIPVKRQDRTRVEVCSRAHVSGKSRY